MGDATTKLVDEFCSLLDETIILVISSDYDLTQTGEFEKARNSLLTLSQNVELEEATGFNPSGLGTGGLDITSPDLNEGPASESLDTSAPDSSDSLTTTTESSQSQSHVSSGWSRSVAADFPLEPLHITVFDDLGDDDKETQLLQMFTLLKPVDVKLALKKFKGNAGLAIDELLNIEYLEQTGQRLKGVEAFNQPDNVAPGKKKRKGKKKKGEPRVSPPESRAGLDAKEPRHEVLNDGKVEEDVAFLAERLNLPEPEVSTIYLSCNKSVGSALVQYLDNYIDLGVSSDRPLSMFPGGEDAAKKYSWIPARYLVPIYELTSPNRQFAWDLVDLLGQCFEKPAYLKYDVAYNVAASQDEIVHSVASNALAGGKPSTVAMVKSVARSDQTNLSTAARVSAATAVTKNHSFASASAAFRRGRSDPLFRQVGGYYAERAREQYKDHVQARGVEADYLVSSRSTRDYIDLHGVTVQDGVNIAIDRVWQWWNTLGEDRARKAKDGFTVVTGQGRHNVDGRSRLRTNVFKALVEDGWRIEVLTGQYLVTGRRR